MREDGGALTARICSAIDSVGVAHAPHFRVSDLGGLKEAVPPPVHRSSVVCSPGEPTVALQHPHGIECGCQYTQCAMGSLVVNAMREATRSAR